MKGLLKGFWWPFRSLKSVKYSQSYGLNEVCDRLNIEVEKVDTHKGITVKVLLDSGTMEMFIDHKIVAKYRFRL